jgi:hypothetical protein
LTCRLPDGLRYAFARARLFAFCPLAVCFIPPTFRA